jgi:hypothetical protein
LHAAPKEVLKTDFEGFYQRSETDGQKVMVYRLKPNIRKQFLQAIEKANSMLVNLIISIIFWMKILLLFRLYRKSFQEDHIFKLEPMTFIDPKTGKRIHSGKNFIKKNLKVPEGEPGCNPNGLAGSDKLERIGAL